jgi:hypothetical protein
MANAKCKNSVSRIADQAITTADVSQLLVLTEARLRALEIDGWIKRIGPNQWPLVATMQGYLGFLRADGRRTSKSAAESRVRDARAREIEIRIAERMRRLIQIDDALETVDAVCGAVRTELAGLPARITRDLSLRNKIEQEANESLSRIADRFEQEANTLRKGGGATATIAPADA